MSDMPEMVKIRSVVKENLFFRTFVLDKSMDAKPGQFVMVWLPRVDEKPFSLSCIEGGIAITVENKGAFTNALFSLKEGDSIGIRGPYGNGFPVLDGRACIVAGGCGIAPLRPLIKSIENPVVIAGARNKDRLLFLDDLKGAMVMTDDGSFGEKGFVTDALEKALRLGKISYVLTCGPEIMMKAVYDICRASGIPCYVSLERFMKCGFGVCGQCEINGFRVCRDGPVFGPDRIEKMPDFGNSARLKTGRKVSVSDYARWRSCK